MVMAYLVSAAVTWGWQLVQLEGCSDIAVEAAPRDMVAFAGTAVLEVDMVVPAGMAAVEGMEKGLAGKTAVGVFASAQQPTHRRPQS